MLVFEERGKSEYPEKNLLEQGRVNQQQTQPTYDAESGNRTQATFIWSEASALTTAPSLLPNKIQHGKIIPLLLVDNKVK